MLVNNITIDLRQTQFGSIRVQTVNRIVTHQNDHAEGCVCIRKVPGYLILRCVEQRKCKSADQHGGLQVCDPGCDIFSVPTERHMCSQRVLSTPTSFVRKPDLAFDLNRRCDLLGHPDLRWEAVDRVVVTHGGHLAVLVLLSVWDIVYARVPGPTLEGLLGERRQRGGGEGREDLGHGIPGPAEDARVAPTVVAAIAGLIRRPEPRSGGLSCRRGGHR